MDAESDNISVNSYMDNIDYYVTENIVTVEKSDYLYNIFSILIMVAVISGLWLLMPLAMSIQSIACKLYEVCKNTINRIHLWRIGNRN